MIVPSSGLCRIRIYAWLTCIERDTPRVDRLEQEKKNMATEWFHSTRLKTRTKESNICASTWVSRPACAMKVGTEMLVSAADQSIGTDLSMSIFVRRSKVSLNAGQKVFP